MKGEGFLIFCAGVCFGIALMFTGLLHLKGAISSFIMFLLFIFFYWCSSYSDKKPSEDKE